MKKGKLKGTLVFWFWFWFGPVVVALLGVICWGFIGESETLSVVYRAISFLVQPYSCYLGALWAVEASGRRHECVKLNCMVATEISILFLVTNWFHENLAGCVSMGIAAAVCGAMAWRESKLAKIEEPEEPEKPKEKNTKRQDNYLVLLLLTLAVAILAFAIGVEVGKRMGY